MGDTTRNIAGAPSIGFYNYAGDESAVSFDIIHANSFTYSDGKLSIDALMSWELLRFLKQSGIIFSEGFPMMTPSNLVIPGWIVEKTAGTPTIQRYTTTKFGHVFMDFEAAQEGFIYKTVKIPKQFSSGSYKIYIYVAGTPAGGDNAYVSVVSTQIGKSDVELLAWTLVTDGPSELTGIGNRAANNSITIKIGKLPASGNASAFYIENVIIFSYPDTITPDADAIPFAKVGPESGTGDSMSKVGLKIEIPVEDGNETSKYVFRGCSFIGSESWGLGDDISTTAEFSYNSLTIEA